MMNIPFSPPFIDDDVIDEVLHTLRSKWITTGPKVAALEQEIVKLTTSKAAVCVNSWTSGAILMLKWFGVKEGDEVIVPAYTYSATALSVLHCGATPVMVDIDDDFCISPQAIRKAITPRTKAIMAVDIAGWPCDYDELNAMISEPEIAGLFVASSVKQQLLNRILLISDAAHSLGATFGGFAAAKKSDVTIFSFHAVKNVTTAEGGCICLNLPDNFDAAAEYKYLRMYTLNGQTKDALSKSLGGGWKYDILFQGLKINMPDICAAIGLAQIKKYKTELLPSRKDVALKYCDGFKDAEWFIAPPLKDQKRESSYHLFPLRIKNITEEQRDRIIDDITSMGIAVNVHFIPMPLLTLFKNLGYHIDDYPVAYKQYASEISLPIYPQLTAQEIAFIIASVIGAVEKELASNQAPNAGSKEYEPAAVNF
ncbi:DegT/DnrJ/EryC1/StrS family aminotransferase [Mucilaginibacter pocheonensis]|uniref:dTDP-4-amino-4,6-dideoxygalactose transaminase n=1 Tax=Mucilaginibacter pocheonensis TaxID=398050 RepID=A0ABU1T5Q1_9SPHI|nr:DegT/DnrJ/EryC1/StrS family aminotransferase [Mucilaginibacter pocheonensis]MDR6940216.1 dTDP-4-amino-4,6-dideoxygalactose transaminase [Mucilaginibacter pocheonensis]